MASSFPWTVASTIPNAAILKSAQKHLEKDAYLVSETVTVMNKASFLISFPLQRIVIFSYLVSFYPFR